jgi:DNA-binding phage protein
MSKALSADGNPQLSTILKVAKALGLELTVRPAA